jgi:hypothetical protein
MPIHWKAPSTMLLTSEVALHTPELATGVPMALCKAAMYVKEMAALHAIDTVNVSLLKRIWPQPATCCDMEMIAVNPVPSRPTFQAAGMATPSERSVAEFQSMYCPALRAEHAKIDGAREKRNTDEKTHHILEAST